MSRSWYAVQCQSRKEAMVAVQLETRGFSVYLPMIRVNPVNPRAAKQLAYFPGYLFVQADLQQSGVSLFNHLPFTVGLVAFGGAPATVPHELLAQIDHELQRRNLAGGEVFSRLKPGDRVRLKQGAFAGYEGVFDLRLGGSDRVRVLIRLIGERVIPLQVPVGMLEVLPSAERR
jgi:transcription antitermination factor NusG